MGQHQQADGLGNGLQVAGSDLGRQPVRPVALITRQLVCTLSQADMLTTHPLWHQLGQQGQSS